MQNEKPIRVQKAIADRGIASRRQAEQMIAEGRVTLNGMTVALGDTCLPGQDIINVDGRNLPRHEATRIVIAMNKPKGFVCTNDDPHAQKTVFELLPLELRKERLFCVGRLDKESEGLLLITNDGQIQQKLAHPSYGVMKKYHVELDKPLKEALIPKLKRGIQWEGDRLSVEQVIPRKARTGDNWQSLEVILHHGKKREIRRLFYAFGYDVKKLKRVQIGQLLLKGIPRGHIRTLGKREIELLFKSKA